MLLISLAFSACACSNSHGIAATASTRVQVPTTTSTTIAYDIPDSSTLTSIFQATAQSLMGALPLDSEVQAFVNSYQSTLLSCEQETQSPICPSNPTPQASAQTWIEDFNKQDIAKYQEGEYQILNSICSVPAPYITPDVNFPTGYATNPDCPVGSPANPAGG